MLFKKLIPALLWAAFILALCALPGSAIPELNFLEWLKPDKIVHLVLFGILSYFFMIAFSAEPPSAFLFRYAGSISIIISGLYGVVVELLQEHVFTGRHGDVYDSIADALGAVMGIWFFIYRRKRKISRRPA